MGQQLVDRHPAAIEQSEKARNVPRRHAGTEIAAFQRALFRDQRDGRQGQHRFRIRQPRRHRRSAPARDGIAELERLHRASKLERGIDAAFRGFPYLADDVRIGCIEGVGRAEFARRLQLLVELVDGDDRLRTVRRRTKDGRKADAAEADDCRLTAGFDIAAVEHRTRACQHRTAHQRRDVQWNILLHLHQ